ncbi:hypothetical protein Gotur_022361 [Gossypium turneri]
MAQMQATTVEVQRKYEELQLQLKADTAARETEAASREAEVQRKYEELQLQLKADAAAREAEAAAREAEQRRKYDELQQQLQNMMKMFQQSQHPPS